MSESPSSAAESAWSRLRSTDSPYSLDRALTEGVSRRGVRLMRVRCLRIDDTAAVTVLRQEPWGGVSVRFVDGRLENFHVVADGPLEVASDVSSFSVVVRFPALRFTGRLEVLLGTQGGEPMSTLGLDSELVGQPADAASLSDRTQIAHDQQSKLIATDNGRLMVATYWDNNPQYDAVVKTNRFKGQWELQQTQDNVQATVTASQNPSQNFSGGKNSPYNIQSFLLQGTTIQQSFKLGNDSSDPVEKQKFFNAANAASTFGDNTKGPSQDDQSFDSTFNLVANSKRSESLAALSPQSEAAKVREAANKSLDEIESPLSFPLYSDDDPEDFRKGHQLAEELFAQPEPEDAPAIAEAGTFEGRVSIDAFRIEGRLESGGDHPELKITGASCDLPTLALQLGGLPADLSQALSEAIGKSGFLQDVLARKIRSALQSGQVLEIFDRLLELSLNDSFGSAD